MGLIVQPLVSHLVPSIHIQQLTYSSGIKDISGDRSIVAVLLQKFIVMSDDSKSYCIDKSSKGSASSSDDDDSDISGYDEFGSFVGGEPLLDWEQGSAIVVLNSVFYLHDDLEEDCCFSANHLAVKEPIGEKKYIGIPDEDDGMIYEDTFVNFFREKGYAVMRTDLADVMQDRNDGNASTSFIVQGVGERREGTEYILAKQNKLGIQYLSGSKGCAKEEDKNWLHCIHVVPILDCFYCSNQRDEDQELLACPFAWLCLKKDGVLGKEGYMRQIVDVW